MSAQAQLRQAQINLDYTEIRAPGRRQDRPDHGSRIGNVVSPEFGTARDDRQPGSDVCGVPDLGARRARSWRARYRDKGGVNAIVVKLRLSDGSRYGQDGKIDYVDPTVATNTDTILIRAAIPNPQAGHADGRARWSTAR